MVLRLSALAATSALRGRTGEPAEWLRSTSPATDNGFQLRFHRRTGRCRQRGVRPARSGGDGHGTAMSRRQGRLSAPASGSAVRRFWTYVRLLPVPQQNPCHKTNDVNRDEKNLVKTRNQEHAEPKREDKDPTNNACLNHEGTFSRTLRIPDAEVSADHSTKDADNAADDTTNLSCIHILALTLNRNQFSRQPVECNRSHLPKIQERTAEVLRSSR